MFIDNVDGIFSPPDPHSLALRCLVNGEPVQSSNTDQMIFRTEALVSWVSRYAPLRAFGLTKTFCFIENKLFAFFYRNFR